VEVERFSEDELFGRPDVVPLEMAPGDVLLHAISAPHGSRANDSETLRRVFYVHYMAKEVRDALHPDWAETKRGFGPADVEAVELMIQERARAGLAGPSTAKVDLTPDGLVFAGEPITAPRRWQTLIDALTAEQVNATKTLAP
jgi:ectoine hydroxylase-related dioxygenase (phytanoyl-CoA dioxygenase family)